MIVAVRPFLRTARQCEVETSRPVPNLATFSLSNLEPLLTLLPATHPQNSPVTPFAATHTNSPSCKSFPCHTYKKQGVSPLGVRRSCHRFHGRHPRAPRQPQPARRATISPLF